MSDDVQSGWALLFKFGKRQHLKEMRESGLLYLSPQQYFSKLEGDAARSDQFEGTDAIHQPHSIKHIKIGDNLILRPEQFVGPVSIGLGGVAYNLFCMFALKRPGEGLFVDGRNFAFGDSCVIVLDTQVFIDRFQTAANGMGFASELGFISYYDVNTYSGDTSLFQKPSKFSYQNEFRLAICPGAEKPIVLNVGRLDDITTDVFPLAEVNQLIENDWVPEPFGEREPDNE